MTNLSDIIHLFGLRDIPATQFSEFIQRGVITDTYMKVQQANEDIDYMTLELQTQIVTVTEMSHNPAYAEEVCANLPEEMRDYYFAIGIVDFFTENFDNYAGDDQPEIAATIIALRSAAILDMDGDDLELIEAQAEARIVLDGVKAKLKQPEERTDEDRDALDQTTKIIERNAQR